MIKKIINGKEFAKYDDTYYVSKDGDIYSTYSDKLLKHGIDLNGYHRVDIHGKHIKVHKMVWIAWMKTEPINQLNHKDDNKDNNHLDNLYDGTQKENISDCIKNGTRKGNVHRLVVFDKQTNEELAFCPSSDFAKYSGHSISNRSVKRVLNRNWFKKRYKLIDFSLA